MAKKPWVALCVSDGSLKALYSRNQIPRGHIATYATGP